MKLSYKIVDFEEWYVFQTNHLNFLCVNKKLDYYSVATSVDFRATEKRNVLRLDKTIPIRKYMKLVKTCSDIRKYLI